MRTVFRSRPECIRLVFQFMFLLNARALTSGSEGKIIQRQHISTKGILPKQLSTLMRKGSRLPIGPACLFFYFVVAVRYTAALSRDDWIKKGTKESVSKKIEVPDMQIV